MAQDERFTAGTRPPGAGRIPYREPDELDDASDRLDNSDLDAFAEPYSGSAPAHDEGPGMIQAFLEQQLRERPLPTLLVAVAAGWVAGKLLR